MDMYRRIRASELELVGLRPVLLKIDVDQQFPAVLLSRVEHLRWQLPVPDGPVLICFLFPDGNLNGINSGRHEFGYFTLKLER